MKMNRKLEAIEGTLQRALDEASVQVSTPAPKRRFIHFVRYGWEDNIQLSISGMQGIVHIKCVWLDGFMTAPRLRVFDDGWALLAAMPDVIALLATLDGQNVQPLALCKMLEGLGFVDATPEKNPNESGGE